MSGLTLELAGTRRLIGATLRRDRVRILAWLFGIIVMIAVSAATVIALFPTQADLDAAAAASSNPAVMAFNGPATALDTVGGQIVFQVGAVGLVLVGLMSVLVINRMTRAEEESGRLELIASLPVGRHSPLAAAASIGLMMSAVLVIGTAGSLLIQGLEVGGTLLFSCAVGAVSVVFVATALVTAQVTTNSRVSGGLAGSLLAGSFVVRAVGDMSNGALSWLSPIGWSQKVRAFGDERWWPLLVPAGVSVALFLSAVALLNNRDLGAGLFPSRPGPARATPWLASPLGLAFRLQRGSIVGWAIGVMLTGVTYGVVTTALEDFIRDNEGLADFMASVSGATITESYLATSTHATALIATGFAVQSVLRLRGEEIGQFAEPVLAAAVSRRSWVVSHLAMALAGSVVVLVALGLGLGVSAAATTQDWGLVWQVLAAALVHIPAMWALIGFALLVVGRFPRYVSAAWAACAGGLVIGFFGQAFRFPAWLMSLSPFEHVPLVPAESFVALPLVVLLAAAALMIVVGIDGLDRRDIG